MATSKKRFVFHAEEPLAARIKARSEATGAPVAEVLRRILTCVLFDRLQELPQKWEYQPRTPQPVLFAPKQETR